MDRRSWLIGAAAAAAGPAWTSEAAAFERLREGGVVLALRHALAPGTFDPPGFRLGDCRTQRNLSDDGRAQARRIGQALRMAGLRPHTVRSSPWCRCMETARLAFDRADAWSALGSPVGTEERTYGTQIAELRRAVQQAAQRSGRFEAWVTHMFVLRDLTGESTTSGEGLVLKARADGGVDVLARLAPP